MHAPARLIACLLLIAGAVHASESASFGFWPGKGATTAPGFERMYEHPCGEVAYAKVSKLPTAKSGPLQSEVAVELDRGGKVIRRWPMPVDYSPRALRGEELLVAAGDKGFWVRADGSFAKRPRCPQAASAVSSSATSQASSAIPTTPAAASSSI